jgi:hypothetical protein
MLLTMTPASESESALLAEAQRAIERARVLRAESDLILARSEFLLGKLNGRPSVLNI